MKQVFSKYDGCYAYNLYYEGITCLICLLGSLSIPRNKKKFKKKVAEAFILIGTGIFHKLLWKTSCSIGLGPGIFSPGISGNLEI